MLRDVEPYACACQKQKERLTGSGAETCGLSASHIKDASLILPQIPTLGKPWQFGSGVDDDLDAHLPGTDWGDHESEASPARGGSQAVGTEGSPFTGWLRIERDTSALGRHANQVDG